MILTPSTPVISTVLRTPESLYFDRINASLHRYNAANNDKDEQALLSDLFKMCCVTNGFPFAAEQLGKCSEDDLRVEQEAKKMDKSARDALPLRPNAGFGMLGLSCLISRSHVLSLSDSSSRSRVQRD